LLGKAFTFGMWIFCGETIIWTPKSVTKGHWPLTHFEKNPTQALFFKSFVLHQVYKTCNIDFWLNFWKHYLGQISL
jgi:hypothetical protein